MQHGATDLHISSESPPLMRVDGQLTPLPVPPLSANETKNLCYSLLTDSQRHRFEEENELDFSFGIRGLSRFRGNLFVQKGAVGGAFRLIPYEVRGLAELGLPPVVADLTKLPRGLVLVTGPTGSGKSTTLASMIDKINRERHEHIVTIEDPIEFVHEHRKCLVNQREVYADTHGFSEALRHVLRQDPDIVLIGEMRDLETVASALTVAETGHLVLSSLHTNSAVQTINRIIDIFPSDQQPQIRAQLSLILQGVISQQLIPRLDGRGRCPGGRSHDSESRDPQSDPRREGASDLLATAGRADQVRHADHVAVTGRSLPAAADFVRRGNRTRHGAR